MRRGINARRSRARIRTHWRTVLCDNNSLERSAVALEQIGDGGEKPDGDEGRQCGGDDSRDDVAAGEGGLGVHGSLLAVVFRSGKVRCCWDVLSCRRPASVL